MKKAVYVAIFVALASYSHAGNLNDPIVQSPVIIAETQDTSTGVLLPLLLLVLVRLAVGPKQNVFVPVVF